MSGKVIFNGLKEFSLGIDIGGTNTEFGIVDQKGNMVFEDVTLTKNHETANSLADYIYKIIKENGFSDKIIGIGIGAPNGNHFTGNIEFAPNLHWKGVIQITSIFSSTFNCNATLTNDANAAAIGEMLFGAAKGMKNFVTITLGTGLGSGIISDGKIIYGQHGFAGEYGHIRTVHNGRMCQCGRRGCLETYASATGVVKSISELNSPNKASSKLIQLDNPTSKDVSELALEGDLFANEILDYTAEILGNALAEFMCFSDPEAFILFGGCAKAGNPFAEKVKYHMDLNALNIYKGKVQVKISELQNKNAAILGTAAIVFSNSMSNFSQLKK